MVLLIPGIKWIYAPSQGDRICDGGNLWNAIRFEKIKANQFILRNFNIAQLENAISDDMPFLTSLSQQMFAVRFATCMELVLRIAMLKAVMFFSRGVQIGIEYVQSFVISGGGASW